MLCNLLNLTLKTVTFIKFWPKATCILNVETDTCMTFVFMIYKIENKIERLITSANKL